MIVVNVEGECEDSGESRERVERQWEEFRECTDKSCFIFIVFVIALNIKYIYLY